MARGCQLYKAIHVDVMQTPQNLPRTYQGRLPTVVNTTVGTVNTLWEVSTHSPHRSPHTRTGNRVENRNNFSTVHEKLGCFPDFLWLGKCPWPQHVGKDHVASRGKK